MQHKIIQIRSQLLGHMSHISGAPKSHMVQGYAVGKHRHSSGDSVSSLQRVLLGSATINQLIAISRGSCGVCRGGTKWLDNTSEFHGFVSKMRTVFTCKGPQPPDHGLVPPVRSVAAL